MFIVQGMTPATKTSYAQKEILATFERNSDAHKVIKDFNMLSEEEKFSLEGTTLTIEDVLEKNENITKIIKIKNKYTILYVEEI